MNLNDLFRHGLFSSSRSSYFSEFLTCMHLSKRSSTSSIATKQSAQGRTSSLSQYQSIGPLLNIETNFPQVTFF